VPGPRSLPFGLQVVLWACGNSIAGAAVALAVGVLRQGGPETTVVLIGILFGNVVGFVVHVYEALRWRLAESLREVEEVRLRAAHLREQATRAELQALQARINPHFFFNTLNTISALAEDDPRRAAEIVQKLAELFRYTFKVAESGPVPLAEELDFVGRYLTIEQARFGDRLRVVRDVEPAALSVPVPGLILQPLVENAVGHGIAPLRHGGTVRIAARCGAGVLVVEVADDGRGLPPGRDPVREGHGLDNVRQRLLTLYGEGGALDLGPGEGGRGTMARTRIPAPVAAAAAAGAAGAAAS